MSSILSEIQTKSQIKSCEGKYCDHWIRGEKLNWYHSQFTRQISNITPNSHLNSSLIEFHTAINWWEGNDYEKIIVFLSLACIAITQRFKAALNDYMYVISSFLIRDGVPLIAIPIHFHCVWFSFIHTLFECVFFPSIEIKIAFIWEF